MIYVQKNSGIFPCFCVILQIYLRSSTKIGFNFGFPEEVTSYLSKLPRAEGKDEDETESKELMDDNLEFPLDDHITDTILTGIVTKEKESST